MDRNELIDRTRHHAPNRHVQMMHERWRQLCMDFILEANNLLPDGREQALVVTKFEEMLMWGSKVIARWGSHMEGDGT